MKPALLRLLARESHEGAVRLMNAPEIAEHVQYAAVHALVWMLSQEVPCAACAPQPDEVNHPRGMIFVGWGMGWQTCSACSGRAVVS